MKVRKWGRKGLGIESLIGGILFLGIISIFATNYVEEVRTQYGINMTVLQNGKSVDISEALKKYNTTSKGLELSNQFTDKVFLNDKSETDSDWTRIPSLVVGSFMGVLQGATNAPQLIRSIVEGATTDLGVPSYIISSMVALVLLSISVYIINTVL